MNRESVDKGGQTRVEADFLGEVGLERDFGNLFYPSQLWLKGTKAIREIRTNGCFFLAAMVPFFCVRDVPAGRILSQISSRLFANRVQSLLAPTFTHSFL